MTPVCERDTVCDLPVTPMCESDTASEPLRVFSPGSDSSNIDIIPVLDTLSVVSHAGEEHTLSDVWIIMRDLINTSHGYNAAHNT